MKAIILAAGRGLRLKPAISKIPKPLTPLLSKKTILDFQVEKLSKFISINNILVVVGYKKELIMESHPELIFIYNNDYTKTNTSKSLLRALGKINEDAIWLNGDVFFEEKVLDLLLSSKESACLVDRKKCGPEEIKYNVNDKGYIKEISKNVPNAEGEAVGINLIKEKDLAKFRNELLRVDNNDYFEKALENLTLDNKIKLRPIYIGNFFCQEIDFPEDLEKVQNHLFRKVINRKFSKY